MYKKKLGLTLKNNSISYVVVESEDNKNFTPIFQGVRVFEPGVKLEKGKDISLAAEKSESKRSRTQKKRLRARKISLLNVLLKYDLCPFLTTEELKNWRNRKVYLINEAFNSWLDSGPDHNPYMDRSDAATTKLDLNESVEAYKLGRAMYHINQRRGFLSNRLDTTEESEGVVKESIQKLTKEKGDLTLGQYYYNRYLNNEKIRGDYTGRLEHYKEEFDRICEIQKLPNEMIKELREAIFSQLPLKSQKHTIGKCPFEKTKNRCYKSHPVAEKFIMWSFLNNIKIKQPEDGSFRELTPDEKQILIPRFFLKRDSFNFSDLCKQLAPVKTCAYTKNRKFEEGITYFNYPLETTVVSCHTSAILYNLFGPTWDNLKIKNDKNQTITTDDIWHVLKTFDSNLKLSDFAKSLGLSVEQQEQFCKAHLKDGFLKYSQKALKKIIPFLKKGFHLTHAILLANLDKVIGEEIFAKNKEDILDTAIRIIDFYKFYSKAVDIVNRNIKKCKYENWSYSEEAKELYSNDLSDEIKDSFAYLNDIEFQSVKNFTLNLFFESMKKHFGKGQYAKISSLKHLLYQELVKDYDIVEKDIQKLYDPALEDEFKPKIHAKDGNIYLNVPFNESYKNPALMRMMFQLKTVINSLIAEQYINQYTEIEIVFNEDLLSANERRASRAYDRDQKINRDNARSELNKFTSHIKDEMVENYLLWEEQNHICPITKKEIKLLDLISDKSDFVRQPIIPTYLLPDESNGNMMLCDQSFARSRGTKLLAELKNIEEIKENYKPLSDKIEFLKKAIFACRKKATMATTKDIKDMNVSNMLKFSYELDYLNQKVYNLSKEEGFIRPIVRQFSQIGMTSKAIRHYLKTLFFKVFIKKNKHIAPFKKMWNIDDKQLTGYCQNVCDALIVAVSSNYYDELSKYYYNLVINKASTVKIPVTALHTYLDSLNKNIIVTYMVPDKLGRRAKKKLKHNGKIVRDQNGNAIYSGGDSARGILHKDTFYGAVEVIENGKKIIKYTKRKSIESLTDGDIKKIINPEMKALVETGKKKERKILQQIDGLQKDLKKAEKKRKDGIKKKIEQLQDGIKYLYVVPRKDERIVPVHKVKVFAHVTNPIVLKPHGNPSKKEYKRNYLVEKGGNYMMCIYEGVNKEEETERAAVIIDNLTAANYFKASNIKKISSENVKKLVGLVPPSFVLKDTMLNYSYTVKKGTMVLLYKETAKEIIWNDNQRLSDRLYYVRGISVDELVLMHHLENRTVGLVKDYMNQQINSDNKKEGNLDKKKTLKFLGSLGLKFNPKELNLQAIESEEGYRISTNDGEILTTIENIDDLAKTSSIGSKGGDIVDMQSKFPYVKVGTKSMNFLVEGVDFTINKLGEIKRI